MAKRSRKKATGPETSAQPTGDAKPSAAPPPWISRDWVWGLVLLVAVLLAYLPVWQAGFIWDDDAHITRPDLQSWAGLWRIWFDLSATQQYYPLIHTVFWVEHGLWGNAPLGYHLVNVLLQALA